MNTFVMNLQLFAGEKTEKATPKRRREAREKGQVVQSREITSSMILLLSFFSLKWFGSSMFQQLKQLTGDFLGGTYSSQELYTVNNIQSMFLQIMKSILWISGPVLGCILVGTVVINYMQVGFLFTSKTLSLNMNRLNPLEGFRRIFSLRSLVELLKSLMKIAIIGTIVFLDYKSKFLDIPFLLHEDMNKNITFIGNAVLDLAFKAGMALCILAVLDYLYQWWDFEKGLRMSKQEVKEEFKQTEGDPQIKGKIRQKQRQMGMQRMMQEVPKADVVIRNPTHFAVALLYEESKASAPIVVAKGQDYVALKIIEIAKDNKVSIVANKPLAQALYKQTEIGDEIPLEMYQAVAEILAYVYRTKNQLNGRGN